MQRRLAAVNRSLGLDPRRPLPFINARGRTLRDVLDAATDTFREHRVQVGFLDSISRMGYGDLTADRSSNQANDDLNRSFETWVALGHTPRQDATHMFGSQMFEAAGDVMIQLLTQTNSQESATGVGLQVTKANDTPKGDLSVHVLEWDADGLAGVRPSRKNEFPEIEAGKNMPVEQLVEQLLLLRGPSSATTVSDELGRNRSHIARLLSNSDRFVVVRREGKEVFYGAVSFHEQHEEKRQLYD